MPATAKTGHARAALLTAAKAALVEDGHATTSARTIAKRAGVAPGLIYYHFDDLDTLLAETARHFSRERAVVWEAELADCTTLSQVISTAHRLHGTERELGSLVMLGQLLAGGRSNPVIRQAVADNFEHFAGIVEATIERILAGSALEEALDAHGLARTVSAGFLGLELLDDTIPDGTDLFDQLEVLATLADEVLEAGWMTRTWLRRKLGGDRA